jgi:hypothetical protein
MVQSHDDVRPERELKGNRSFRGKMIAVTVDV